ncbi:GHKL domain-containing protein [Limosilactobacillus caccae]|uniref:GHKL domain-containing protein n=1 Tax=Limosilactobacillus caccae TaxID=1926284 RepID=UPI000970C874|nr:GHKL domain-containing protein [Limosilactobacillus caccae]
MQFISTNIPILLNPSSTYPSLAMYIYAFWIQWSLVAFLHVKLFERTSKIKVPLWLYFVYIVAWLLLTPSLGAELIEIVGLTVLVYYFVSRRNVSITALVTYYIFACLMLYLTTGLVGTLIGSFISVIAPTKAFIIRALMAVPITLIEFAIAYWIITKTQAAVAKFVQVVAEQAPVLTWVFNLFMFSFEIFKYAGMGGSALVPSLIYIALIFAYALVMTLTIRYTTKYFQYQALVISQETELKNLQTYTSHIEEMFDDLRRFRHDYKNILTSLGGAIEEGKIDEVRSIYDRTIMATSNDLEERTAVLSHLANINDLEIKSLVYSKVITAIDKDIAVEVEVVDPITLSSKVDVLDAIRIISILFDNAINAADKAAGGKINFTFFNQDHNQYIVIGNSTTEEQIAAAKVSGKFKGLTTQKHSLGLRTLRILLAKYPFIQHNYKSNNHWFEQEIIIHNK